MFILFIGGLIVSLLGFAFCVLAITSSADGDNTFKQFGCGMIVAAIGGVIVIIAIVLGGYDILRQLLRIR